MTDHPDRPVRFLILEDSPADAELMLRALKRDGIPAEELQVEDRPAFEAALEHFGPDVILSDYSLPGYDGATALGTAQQVCPTVPFLLVSGTVGEELAVEFLKLGASDFVLKERMERLPHAVRRALEEARNRRERARAEAELEVSRLRLQVAIEASNIGLWDWNLVTNEVYYSPEWKQQLGYADGEITNTFEEWERRLHPADRDHIVAAALATASNPDIPYDVEFRIRHKDGLYRWMRTRAKVLLDAAGRPSRMLGCHVDVTEYKRVVEALVRTTHQTKMALRAAGMGVLSLDIATGVMSVIQPGGPISGSPPGCLPRHLSEFMRLVHPDDRSRLQERIEAASRSDDTYECEFRFTRADGSIRNVFALGQRVHGPHDAPQLVGVDLDVTERRQLELQFRQAQKMEAIGRLTGGIAHDFNNLLTAIIGYAELLEQDFPPEANREDLEEIINAARSAAKLTGQLLAFSRRQVLQPEALSLNEVVTRAARLLERVLGDDVILKVGLQPDLWEVHADPTQVQQVVVNLAVNARDAMPAGGLLAIETVNLTRTAIRDGGPEQNCVALRVSDSGTGMTEEVKARLFEPFFTTKEVGHGTGLGLSTVYGIVTQSGGRIDVESSPGHGTTFTILLPRHARAGETASAAPASGAHSRRERVLVVEDDPQIRALAAAALERAGYGVVAASSVHEALDLGRRHDIRLVVTDVVLSDGSGIQLASELRRLRPDLRSLYIASSPMDSLGRTLAPDEAVLSKPFTPAALVEKVAGIRVA